MNLSVQYSLILFLTLFVISAFAQPKQSKQRNSEFTVVTYNVENLFDVDGIALFNDYKQDTKREPFGYNRAKFLTKLSTIASVLQTVNKNKGPEIILFQELEADFTPGNSLEDKAAFLELYAESTVADMLGEDWHEEYAGFPSELWLCKALADRGMTGYEIVTAPSRGHESGIAHTNALFSRFPIVSFRLHPLVQARDIIEAEISVDGNPLIVFVNHWKSGASRPEREPVRVENAKVLRGLIDARLNSNPRCDIIVAGDLNSHYNHSILYPGIETGINDILGSSGCENFIENDLYNLWYELSPENRYAEVWRGRLGTLMHILLTTGLYDDVGVSYIDGSFSQLIVPDLNSDAAGRPLRWSFTGDSGFGASDHFPIYARFTTGSFERKQSLSVGNDALDFEPILNLYDSYKLLNLSDGTFLNELSDLELVSYVGQLFEVKATVLSTRPLRLKVGTRVWPAYHGQQSFIEAGGLPDCVNRGEIRMIVQPYFYRGESQLLVEGISSE